jgi:hypothetical protein
MCVFEFEMSVGLVQLRSSSGRVGVIVIAVMIE